MDGSTLGLLGLILEILIYTLPAKYVSGTLEHIRKLTLHDCFLNKANQSLNYYA